MRTPRTDREPRRLVVKRQSSREFIAIRPGSLCAQRRHGAVDRGLAGALALGINFRLFIAQARMGPCRQHQPKGLLVLAKLQRPHFVALNAVVLCAHGERVSDPSPLLVSTLLANGLVAIRRVRKRGRDDMQFLNISVERWDPYVHRGPHVVWGYGLRRQRSPARGRG